MQKDSKLLCNFFFKIYFVWKRKISSICWFTSWLPSVSRVSLKPKRHYLLPPRHISRKLFQSCGVAGTGMWDLCVPSWSWMCCVTVLLLDFFLDRHFPWTFFLWTVWSTPLSLYVSFYISTGLISCWLCRCCRGKEMGKESSWESPWLLCWCNRVKSYMKEHTAELWSYHSLNSVAFRQGCVLSIVMITLQSFCFWSLYYS